MQIVSKIVPCLWFIGQYAAFFDTERNRLSMLQPLSPAGA